eukprot:274613_1
MVIRCYLLKRHIAEYMDKCLMNIWVLEIFEIWHEQKNVILFIVKLEFYKTETEHDNINDILTFAIGASLKHADNVRRPNLLHHTFIIKKLKIILYLLIIQTLSVRMPTKKSNYSEQNQSTHLPTYNGIYISK